MTVDLLDSRNKTKFWIPLWKISGQHMVGVVPYIVTRDET